MAFIEGYRFGKMVVNGKTYRNDLKIVNGKVIPEWWRKKGHLVEIEDVQELTGSRLVIIGKGKPGLMRLSSAVKDFFAERDVEFFEADTESAVRMFNKWQAEGRNPSAGFHLTC